MTKRAIKITVIIGAAIVGLWQFGSYGPFFVVVRSADDRALQDILVYLRRDIFSSHGGATGYSVRSVGRTSEVITIPRRFVCVCFSTPSILIEVQHPYLTQYGAQVEKSLLSRFSAIHIPLVTLQPVIERLSTIPAWYKPGDDRATDDAWFLQHQKEGVTAHQRGLVRSYEPFVDVGENKPEYLDMLRQQLALAGMSNEQLPGQENWFRMLEARW